MTLAQKIRSWFGLIHKCDRCGRELHDKKSIRRGMGPECWKAYEHEMHRKMLYGPEDGYMVSPEVTKAVIEGAREATVIRDLSPTPMEGLEKPTPMSSPSPASPKMRLASWEEIGEAENANPTL